MGEVVGEFEGSVDEYVRCLNEYEPVCREECRRAGVCRGDGDDDEDCIDCIAWCLAWKCNYYWGESMYYE